MSELQQYRASKPGDPIRIAVAIFCALAMIQVAGQEAQASGEQPKVSFHRQIMPIFKRDCIGCHRPDKAEGKLDMSTYASLAAGGETDVPWTAGDPDFSFLIEMIEGDKPLMPKEADPLDPADIALIRQWILEGALEDEPVDQPGQIPDHPTLYTSPPVISDLEYSPDGSILAVTGHHEIILLSPDGTQRIARLMGGSPRIESIAFSPDGTRLAASGGRTGEFGEIQIWDVAEKRLVKSIPQGTDVLFGISFSPSGHSVGFGCSDNTARSISLDTFEQTIEFHAHTDWVLNTLFTLDGALMVSGGRDKAIKMIAVANGQFIDDINNPLDMILSMDRHPTQNKIVYGGELGIPRIYQISDNQNRTNQRNDTNMLMEGDYQGGAIHAAAFSQDGELIAIGGAFPAVRLYSAKGTHAELTGHSGAIYAIDTSPDGKQIATAGFDGMIRIYDIESGELTHSFYPVPILTKEQFIAGLR